LVSTRTSASASRAAREVPARHSGGRQTRRQRRIGDHLGHAAKARTLAVRLRESKQGLHDVIHLANTLHDLAGKPTGRRRVFGTLQQRSKAHHAVERVLDLVGDAESQLGESRQAIEAMHFPFEFLHVRTILEHHELRIGQGYPLHAHQRFTKRYLAGGLQRQVDAVLTRQGAEPLPFTIAAVARTVCGDGDQADRQCREDRFPLLQRLLQRPIGCLQFEVHGFGARLQLGVTTLKLLRDRDEPQEALLQGCFVDGHWSFSPGQVIDAMSTLGL
jgi:hypothetical protein